MKNLLFATLCLFPLIVFSRTFEQGMSYYKGEQFVEAYQVFDSLAQLGNERAQFNIGVMHLRGEHFEQDLPEAWAWMKVAQSNGFDSAGGALGAIESRLTQDELTYAHSRFDMLMEQYGNDAITKRLLPTYENRNANISPSRANYVHQPIYPRNMLRRGQSGYVDLQYVVGKDGSPRYFNVIYSTDRAFQGAALEALKRSRFEPSHSAEQSTLTFGQRYRYIFTFEENVLKIDELNDFLAEGRHAAYEGGSQEKLSFAYNLTAMQSSYRSLEGFESINWDNPGDWFAKAAQDGSALAKYQLGLRTLRGDQCDIDYSKSLFWLTRAAAENVLDAQFALGYELLVGLRFDQDNEEATRLLHQAADQGLSPAQALLAWLLVTHPSDNFRSTEKAAQYFSEIDFGSFNDQRSYYETATALALAQQDWRAANRHLKSLSTLNKKYETSRVRELALAEALEQQIAYIEEL